MDQLSRDGECITIHGHTRGRSASCPCCGRRSSNVHGYRLRKIQCTEFLGYGTTLLLRTRRFVCPSTACPRKTFAEPLSMTVPYGRNTHEVQSRIRHEALGQTAQKASASLRRQHIRASASTCIRMLRRMGASNPEVRTSGYVGLDDFAKRKGHSYMCAVVDHYTRAPLAVFDSRYGQEIADWLRLHPEIRVVTRDGSRSYAGIISGASGRITQVSDRFHLMKNLKDACVDPVKTLLGRERPRMPYPYPTEEEAYRYLMGDIFQMGDARHRATVRAYYDARHLRDEGVSGVQIAAKLGFSPTKVYKLLQTDISRILSPEQKKAMAMSREMARIISQGHITPDSVVRNMEGKADSGIIHRCMRTLYSHYRALRDEVRRQNGETPECGRSVKVRGGTVWRYIVTGRTGSNILRRLRKTHPEVDQIMQICIGFRKMLHQEEDAPSMDDWLKEADKCRLKEIKAFARHVRSDRKAIEQACATKFCNALLEGTVNKAKAVKRTMFNRAKVEVLRAKLLYNGLKCGWNYHLN